MLSETYRVAHGDRQVGSRYTRYRHDHWTDLRISFYFNASLSTRLRGEFSSDQVVNRQSIYGISGPLVCISFEPPKSAGQNTRANLTAWNRKFSGGLHSFGKQQLRFSFRPCRGTLGALTNVSERPRAGPMYMPGYGLSTSLSG